MGFDIDPIVRSVVLPIVHLIVYPIVNFTRALRTKTNMEDL
jgi:hypothetical protein